MKTSTSFILLTLSFYLFQNVCSAKNPTKPAEQKSSDVNGLLDKFERFHKESNLIIHRRTFYSSIGIGIPMFSFKLPFLMHENFLKKQAIFGILTWILTVITFGISFLFTGSTTLSGGPMGKIANNAHFNYMDGDLSNIIGLDGLKCLQKVICQSYRFPKNKRYGVFGWFIRHLFPESSQVQADHETLDMDANDFKLSVFQVAAQKGRKETKDCDLLYDCLVDPLGSIRYLLYYWNGQ